MAMSYPSLIKDVLSSWTSSRFKMGELHHTWHVHDFSLCCQEMGKSIQSSVFGAADGPQWVILLYPRGQAGTEAFVSIYLKLHSLNSNSKEIPVAKYRFSYWNSKLENIHIFGVNYEFTLWKGSSVGVGYGSPKLIKRDVLIKLLKDDQIRICCEIIICGNKKKSSSDEPTNKNKPCLLPIPDCTLSHDYQSMFSCQKFGNITIEVKDQKFLVYQGILETRSPVFAAMFNHEMAEQRENRVVITDFEPSVVEEMLIYIYTGRSPNLEEMANDLLPIADKYDLKRLKSMTQEALSRKLTKENAIEILTLADLHQAYELKTFVIMFIITNSSHFLKSSVWENIVLSLYKHPNLTVELTRALCASKE